MLRANGHSLEAARLQSTELSRTLTRLRESVAASAESDARLQALFAAEEERVLNARTLAELLAPLLSEHLGPRAAPAFAPVSARSAPASVVASTPAAGTPSPAVPAGVPGIADFIDEMLAQERAPLTAAPRRRAS